MQSHQSMTARHPLRDTPITGQWHQEHGDLRLWSAGATRGVRITTPSTSQRFTEAIVERERTDISRVPPQRHHLRGQGPARQQYFFCSASRSRSLRTTSCHHW